VKAGESHSVIGLRAALHSRSGSTNESERCRYIAGEGELIETLKFQAPGLVYSVGMSPPVAAAALEALRLLEAEPERVARLQANGRLFLDEAKARGLNTVTSEGYAIVPVMVGDLITAGRLTDRMLACGVNVLPII
jgi:8-amino-7-oxononanoate synthase